MSCKHEEQNLTERAHIIGLKAQVTHLTDQLMKVEELFRVSLSKYRMALAEVRMPDAQRRNMLGHLRIFS